MASRTDEAEDLEGAASPETTTATAPRHTLHNDPDDILHLVCCRDPEWRVAFCGEEDHKINYAAETLCTMCVEVAQQRLPTVLENDPPICPMDHQPCPDEHEIDLIVLGKVSP